MKRFWAKTQIALEGEQYLVQLDGKSVKLPSGKPLAVPFRALAEGIAGEWNAIGPNFLPDDLPLTQLATTAQERVRLKRDEIIRQLAAFGMNDLLCYRAADQPDLLQIEVNAWQPWIDWVELQLGITLRSTAGIVPVEQSMECRDAFVKNMSAMDEYQIAGLGVIVPMLGSLVLGLGIKHGVLSPKTACECANVGEIWQETRWGTDEEAKARRLVVAEDVAVSAHFMVLCQI